MKVLILLASLVASCSAGRSPVQSRLQLHSASQHQSASTSSSASSSSSKQPSSSKGNGVAAVDKSISSSSKSSAVPVFADLTSSYEPHWLQEVVLSGVKEECGLALRLENREGLQDAAIADGGVLIATGGDCSCIQPELYFVADVGGDSLHSFSLI